MDSGICYIKSEYLIPESNQLKQKEVSNEEETQDRAGKRQHFEDVSEKNSNKYQKIGKEKKRKSRGQNKDRPVFKETRGSNLCNVLFDGPTDQKCTHPNCIYMHDIEKYLELKPKDIGDTCYIYSTKGYCSRGLTCRFARSHLDSNYNNLKSDIYKTDDVSSSTVNGIVSDLQVRLRKREYDFKATTEIVKEFEKLVKGAGSTGCVIDTEEISETEREKKSINFRNKLFLSPLTTVGNLPFRRICKEFGADITCGEMACAVPIVKGLTQEWALTKRHISEDIFGVQLCGNGAQLLAQAAQLLKENSSVDFIDLNIGCPIELIYNQGGGSALMRRQNVLEVIVRSCSKILGDIPFNVKTRTGVYANKSVAHELIPKLETWGASAVTLHGRSREQRYTKNSDWEYIEKCAASVKHIPVIGNGDILNYEDYNEKKKIAPHVSSVMIGRGALIKPWIFKEIKEQKYWDPSSSERFDLLKKYVNYGLEHWGSDTKGVENTRRFLLEWQSFLYRYVPASLLEHPPQRINQRPQKYHGRDDLETLLSSNNCADWIKISEMLLGPVPDGFTFLPKHKANAY